MYNRAFSLAPAIVSDLRQLNTVLQEFKLRCTRRKDKDNQKNHQAYQEWTGAACSNAVECALGLYARTHSL